MTPPIRVLVVDDSALARKLLVEILQSDPEIQVVGTAANPHVARRKIKELNPTVLTLDVEMPEMDGLTFLGHLMRLRPMPVVMVSAFTEEGALITLEALELGAVDFVTKPRIDIVGGLREQSCEIIRRVKGAALAFPPARTRLPKVASDEKVPRLEGAAARRAARRLRATGEPLVAVGASTGGTEAIAEILAWLPAWAPALVVAQHIPARFSGPFARRLDGITAMQVQEAAQGERILPGCVYVAPGGGHLEIDWDEDGYFCRLDGTERRGGHRPSIDSLFRSVARCAGVHAVGVLLTGMGDDGARGLQAILEAGGQTIAQDQATSLIWGMPAEAIARNAARRVLPLGRIAPSIMSLALW